MMGSFIFMHETQDVALRSFERGGEWSRVAFTWARAGETWNAYTAAVRATAHDPQDPARALLVPTDLVGPAPWSGLRRFAGMRTIATRLDAESAVDLGRGLLALADRKCFVV